jgi:hypothetical protein
VVFVIERKGIGYSMDGHDIDNRVLSSELKKIVGTKGKSSHGAV